MRATNLVTVLGAGLTGLTSAYFLQQRGCRYIVVERDSEVGGLAKTVDYKGYKFDLGGHRFLTDNTELEQFVKNLLNDRYLVVNRTSNIYLNNQFIKYPLQPWDAFRKVGFKLSMRFIYDYIRQKCQKHKAAPGSLENWVINRFGKSLYQVFFKGYSEKVWGMDCTKIDSDWIALRIQNLSLAKALKSIFVRKTKKQYATLTDKFLYPKDGIGDIPNSLRRQIDASSIELESSIERICHDGGVITSIEYRQNGQLKRIEPKKIISTIPVATLVNKLDPLPPKHIIEAASSLRSRDLVLVTLMLDQEQMSKESWVYFPEKEVPFGRLHEPKNWSSRMAPKGKTAVVTEHFCFRGDKTWSSTDHELTKISVDSLCQLGFMQQHELIDSTVHRIGNAYPLFSMGYRQYCDIVSDYLGRFSNLNLAGRTGAFRYYNMDQAMLSGINAVEQLTGEKIQLAQHGLAEQGSPIHIDSMNGGQNEMCPNYSSLAT